MIILVLIYLYFIWGWACFDWTSSQRNKIIDSSPKVYDPEFWEDFRKVSFTDHLRELMWFRDPMLLYSDKIRELSQVNSPL